MKVETLPLKIDVDIASPSWVRTPLPMSLVLQNNSQQLLSFDICIEHNEVDAFMFSGCKQVSQTPEEILLILLLFKEKMGSLRSQMKSLCKEVSDF